MSVEYRIAESELAVESIASTGARGIAKKLQEYVYPQLRQNPHYGPNIKKLKGELTGFYRYRVGRLRVFYTIDEGQKLVLVHDIEQRKDAYKRR